MFGARLTGSRCFNSGSYAYSFNGKRDDPETGTQDYGMRIYNPSLGRFLSVDPLASSYPWYTPYQFAGNKPIWCTDLDGLEENFKPLEKYKYGKETGLKTVTKNYVKAIPNAATNIVNGLGSLFSVVVYNVSELARSPEDYFEEVGDYWSQSGADLQHMKAKASELANNPAAILEPLSGPEGFENILTIGAQLAMTTKAAPEFSSEVNYLNPTTPALSEAELQSGQYGTLKSMVGGEKHHIPSNSSMNEVGISKYKGTAINTEKKLHRGLPSTGASDAAKIFRRLETNYLKAGNYEAAWEMNVKPFKEAYMKKGLSEKFLDEVLNNAKADFMKRVVPQIKKP